MKRDVEGFEGPYVPSRAVQTLQVECDDRHAPHRNARWYNPATSWLRALNVFNLLDAILIAVFGSDVQDR
jgi:hypothetical protein